MVVVVVLLYVRRDPFICVRLAVPCLQTAVSGATQRFEQAFYSANRSLITGRRLLQTAKVKDPPLCDRPTKRRRRVVVEKRSPDSNANKCKLAQFRPSSVHPKLVNL